MKTFLLSHLNLDCVVITCAVMFVVGFFRGAYEKSEAWARIGAVARVVCALIIFTALVIVTPRRHLSPWLPITAGCSTLVFMAMTASAMKKRIAEGDHEPSVAMERMPSIGVKAVRFGPHELMIGEDRVWTRRHPTSREICGVLATIVVNCILIIWLWRTGYRINPFSVALVCSLIAGAGKGFGEMVKARIPKMALRLRPDGALIVDGKEAGSLAEYVIDVVPNGREQQIRLIDQRDTAARPYILATTHDKSLKQAEGIADAFRTFLEEHRVERVWPPAPVGIFAYEVGS